MINIRKYKFKNSLWIFYKFLVVTLIIELFEATIYFVKVTIQVVILNPLVFDFSWLNKIVLLTAFDWFKKKCGDLNYSSSDQTRLLEWTKALGQTVLLTLQNILMLPIFWLNSPNKLVWLNQEKYLVESIKHFLPQIDVGSTKSFVVWIIITS